MILCVSLIIPFLLAIPITDIIEGTSTPINNWKFYDSSPFTQTFNCNSNQLEGPFLGKVPQNIQKQFQGLNPHYSLFISLDILYTEYWTGIGNFVEILLDNQQIIKDTNINTLSFTTPNSYCQNSILRLCIFNQQLKTIQKLISHSSINPLLKIQSTFNCLLITLTLCCEEFLIKNIILQPLECHFSCLTCTGPNENDCTSCPYGSTNNGKCQCSIGTYQYNYQCVSSCPQFYIIINNQCIIECSLNCQVCQNNDCKLCDNGYFLHQGICVQQCPKNSIADNKKCIDYSELSTYGSTYIAKHFIDVNALINDLSLFTFTFNPTYSKLTGQIYSVYNNNYLLGGFGVWSNGAFSISYNNLQPHNKLRIYLTAWIIDNWSGEFFKIILDGQEIYSKQYFTNSYASNLFYNSENDYIDQIQLSINHLSTSANFIFQSTLQISSFQASIAFSNIFILIDYCDHYCSQCSASQCQQCQNPYQILNNKCGLCDSTYNRQNNCLCLNGYYDDGLNQQCQQCKAECETCDNQNTCLECKYGTNLIILPYCMNCNIGYFYQSGQCQPCNADCLSCFGPNQDQCLTCKDFQILNLQNQCQSCLENQFKSSDILCVDCRYNCYQCLNETSCTICKENRTNAPFCYCQDGYFEDNDQNCKLCNSQCLTCEFQANNCLTCSGNRKQAPECFCPNEDSSNSIWCTDCKTAVLNIFLNSDSSQIKILFSQKINQMYSDCSSIIKPDTLSLLGSNPQCQINNYSISIVLGSNPSIQFEDPINLYSNIIQFYGCQTFVQNFVNTILKQTNQQNPILYFSQQEIQLISCEGQKTEIFVTSVEHFGQGKVTLLQWNFVKYHIWDDSILKLVGILNSQISQQNDLISFSFPFIGFNQNIQFVLELQYQNFIKIQGSSLFSIQYTNNTFYLKLQEQRSSYLISQPILILIILSNCNTQTNSQELYNLTTIVGSIIQSAFTYVDNKQTVEFKAGELSIGTYEMRFNVYDQTNLFLISESITIKIIPESPDIQLITESNYLGYKQKLNITSKFLNFDQIIAANVKWECYNLQTNNLCPSYSNSQISSLQSQTFSISYEPFSFEPFSILQISITYQSIKRSTLISIIETDIPKITYETNFNLLSGYINFYDQLVFQFRYSEININPDNLLYIGLLSNDNKIRTQFKFNYLDLQIQLWDYFDIDQLTKQIELKVNIYNPDYFMPSQVVIPLQINIPPQNCQIAISSDLQLSMTSIFSISINDCQDDNYPLQYRIIYYQNQSQFLNDQNLGKLQQGIILFDYSYEQEYQTYLTGNGSIYLLFQIKDSLNGISNYSKSQQLEINISQNHQQILQSNQLADILIYSINLQYQPNISESEKQSIEQKIAYFSQCQCITEVQNLQLKMITASLFEIDQEEINSELDKQYSKLNQILSQITNLNFSDYDKFEHTVEEFSKFSLLEETYQIANYLSILFENNISPQINGRLLQEQQQNKQNDNNMLIIDSSNLIGEIGLQSQIVNSKELKISTNAINITTQKTTTNQLSKYLTFDSSKQDQNQTKNLGNITFSYQMTSFSKNPYLYDSSFTTVFQNSSNYPVQYPQIKSNQNNTQLLDIGNNTIDLLFQNNNNDSKLQCVTKIEDKWSVDACKTINNNGNITCRCQYVSSTTIVQALELIVDQGINFFSLQTIQLIMKCSYQTILFTYIVILYTILFIWFIFYGYNLDQKKLEETQFSQAKVFPTEWDYPSEKQKGIEQIGQIDSTQRLPSVTRLNLRKDTKQRSIFSQNEVMSLEKSFGKRQEFNSQKTLGKKIQGIASNVLSGRIAEETILEDQDQKTVRSPKVRIENNLHTNENNIIEKNNNEPLILRLTLEKISILKGLLFYVEINHKILSLYYLYDKDYSRLYRTIVLYVALLGEISILTFFGEIINLNTIIALSLLQTSFGIVFRKILQIMLSSQKICVNYIGFNMAIVSVLLFLFVILGSLAKYKSPQEGALWGAAYLTSFILEYLVYSNLQFLFYYIIIYKYGNEAKIKFLLKYFLNDKVFIEIFGEQKEQNESK